ncbi:MAG TPA: carboxypeptidase-like regulatory domain-containing protein [Bacteroidales bacterium]
MRLNLHTFLLFALCCLSLAASAQHHENDLVQFSGVVVTSDSLQPVPFTNVVIKSTRRGTTADYFGFFSLVAHKNDIIQFSATGYKKVEYHIPDTLSENRYSLIQVLSSDTIQLIETVIYPWPSREQFKQAFIKLSIPDDDIVIARKNINYMEMRERAQNFDKYPMDGAMNYRNNLDHQIDKLYYNGQTQPLTIFNPFAWAKFIKAWKNGDFKKKKK